MCGTAAETVPHLLTACRNLHAFYKSRHNRVLKLIAKEIIELENSDIAFVDKRWDTVNEWKWNQPDLVILAPSSPQMIPPSFAGRLEPNTSYVGDLTICWDNLVKDREEFKILKYEPLAAILNEEMEREGIDVGALAFGVMGSVSERVPKDLMKYLGLREKQVKKLLREVNILLAEEAAKIWDHVKLVGVFVPNG